MIQNNENDNLLNDSKDNLTKEKMTLLQISYVNYKNEYKVEVVTFSRSSDHSEKTEGNTILNIDMSERFFINSTTPKYNIDSFNLTNEEIMKQCEELIEKLRQEFGQTEAAEIYREENCHVR